MPLFRRHEVVFAQEFASWYADSVARPELKPNLDGTLTRHTHSGRGKRQPNFLQFLPANLGLRDGINIALSSPRGPILIHTMEKRPPGAGSATRFANTRDLLSGAQKNRSDQKGCGATPEVRRIP